MLKQEYKDGLTREEAVALALKVLSQQGHGLHRLDCREARAGRGVPKVYFTSKEKNRR
jgi:20S proteasome alpha/beta subunit